MTVHRFFFTSDWHLGHPAIIGTQQRPFDGLDDMAEQLVANTNKLVHADDKLFILGDLSFRTNDFEKIAGYIERLRCKNKYLLLGNHDKQLQRQWLACDLFEFCGSYLELNPKGFGYTGCSKITMMHYPMLAWNRSRHNARDTELSIMLHGHIHSDGGYNERCRGEGICRYDVGVDANGFKPVELGRIIEFFNEGLKGNEGK